MARLSLKGTLKKNNSGALLTINEALRGLVNSLDLFQEVETRFETARPDHSGSNVITPRFLRLVAGTLKEMVGKLVLDIEAQPEIQTLLRTIQKSVSGAASNGDAPMTNQQPSIAGTLPCEAVCKSGICSRTSKRAAVRGVGRCRHSCEDHPEVMDPVLWSTLPEEVVELVFGRLPIAKVVPLCSHSKAWSTISKSSNFRQVCFERNPKLFGLVGRDKGGRTVCIRVYDIKSNTWISRELGGFPRAFDISAHDHHGYDDSMYACDGGLVCFVPQKNMLVHPILVGNPLTDEWKTLPRLRLKHRKPILVQLVIEDDAGYYRVVLVSRDYAGGALAANCYYSRTSEWSTMDSGLVYGGCNTLLSTSLEAAFVFDCTTKRLFNLNECAALEDIPVPRFSMLKDRMFVLHKCNRGRHASNMYKVSDYAWDSRALDLSRLNTIDSTLSRALPRQYVVHMFSSNGFVLLFGGNHEEDEDQHQLIRLYDLSTNEWHSLDMGEDYRFSASELNNVYMCELRWNAVP